MTVEKTKTRLNIGADPREFQKRPSWTNEDILALLDEEDGTLDPRIYTDEDLYRLEQERVL